MPNQSSVQPEVPELQLGLEHEEPYGTLQTGWVLTSDSATPITVRRPHDDPVSAFIFAPGLSAEHDSMSLPAEQAVYAGHLAVTFDYTNQWSKSALEANAKELVTVQRALQASPEDLEQNTMDLSMSGRVAILAMMMHGAPRQKSAILVAPAGFLPRDPSVRETVQHFSAEAIELGFHFVKQPLTASRVALSAYRHVARRPLGVATEFWELLHGSVHEEFLELKDSSRAPEVHLAYGDRDPLIPAEYQEEGTADMPFDSKWKYPGGHADLVFNPTISGHYFGQDDTEALEPLAA